MQDRRLDRVQDRRLEKKCNRELERVQASKSRRVLTGCVGDSKYSSKTVCSTMGKTERRGARQSVCLFVCVCVCVQYVTYFTRFTADREVFWRVVEGGDFSYTVSTSPHDFPLRIYTVKNIAGFPHPFLLYTNDAISNPLKKTNTLDVSTVLPIKQKQHYIYF